LPEASLKYLCVCIDGITSAHQACWLRWDLTNFVGLTWIYSPLDFHLLGSWDYNAVPPHKAMVKKNQLLKKVNKSSHLLGFPSWFGTFNCPYLSVTTVWRPFHPFSELIIYIQIIPLTFVFTIMCIAIISFAFILLGAFRTYWIWILILYFLEHFGPLCLYVYMYECKFIYICICIQIFLSSISENHYWVYRLFSTCPIYVLLCFFLIIFCFHASESGFYLLTYFSVVSVLFVSVSSMLLNTSVEFLIRVISWNQSPILFF
jgi:hypothetical protein